MRASSYIAWQTGQSQRIFMERSRYYQASFVVPWLRNDLPVCVSLWVHPSLHSVCIGSPSSGPSPLFLSTSTPNSFLSGPLDLAAWNGGLWGLLSVYHNYFRVYCFFETLERNPKYLVLLCFLLYLNLCQHSPLLPPLPGCLMEPRLSWLSHCSQGWLCSLIFLLSFLFCLRKLPLSENPASPYVLLNVHWFFFQDLIDSGLSPWECHLSTPWRLAHDGSCVLNCPVSLLIFFFFTPSIPPQTVFSVPLTLRWRWPASHSSHLTPRQGFFASSFAVTLLGAT